MGNCAELCAKEKGITRARPGRVRRRALPARAARAEARASSSAEIVAGRDRRSARAPPIVVDDDEEPGRGDIEKLPALRPAFQKDGTVTAGNASSINDGAAALVLTAADEAAARGWKPLARIVGARLATRRRPSGSRPRRRARSRTLLERVGWKTRRRRPLGDQRGVRGGVDRQQPAARARPGAGERVGRRGRARPPDRRSGARVLVTLLARAARRAASGAASPRCASAAARASRWPSSWCDGS